MGEACLAQLVHDFRRPAKLPHLSGSVFGGRGGTKDDCGQSLLPVVLGVDSLGVKLLAKKSLGYTAIPLLSIRAKEVKAGAHRYLHTRVHSSSVHYSQEVEATTCPLQTNG